MNKMNLMDLSSYPVFKAPGSEGLDSSVPYLELCIAFTVAGFLFESYLDARQLTRFRAGKGKTPPAGVEKDVYERSLVYGEDKMVFGTYEGTFSLIVMTIGTLLVGYLPWLWTECEKVSGVILGKEVDPASVKSECVTTILFILSMSLVDMVVTFPWSYWKTFKVEAKHGFNKTTFALFVKDKALGLLLTMLIGSPVISVIIWVCRSFTNYALYIWVFLLLFSTFMMVAYPVLIAPLFNKYEELPDGELKTEIYKLAGSIDFPLTGLYTMDGSKRSSHSNAFFYGLWKFKRIVLFDTLIEQCTLDELLSILGHELGHWKLSHTMQGFVISQSYTLILFLSYSYISTSAELFRDFGFAVNAAGAPPVFVGLIVFMQSYWAPVEKVLSFLLNAHSRINEFAADRFSKDMGMEKGLASGLMTINAENLGNMVPDSWYSAYHFSHPPVVERVKALGVDVTKIKLKKREAKKSK